MALSPVIPPVSLVIVNHNAGSVLIDCLRSLAGQATEIVLIDNGSDAGGLDFVSENKFPPSVKIIRLPKNVGFAAGCNIGISACTQDVILLFNPDCIASPGLVQRLWNVLESDERVGMAGGFLQNPDQTEQRGGRRLIPTPGRALAPGFGIEFLARVWPSLFLDFNLNENPLPSEPIRVEAISGACMMMRRSALDDAGLMDEGFFLHCEDLDLCVRFRNRGWWILFDPQARVTHLKGFCSRRKPLFVEWHKHRGMVRFYNKHFRAEYPAILSPLVFLAVWIRFLVVGILAATGARRASHTGDIRSETDLQEFDLPDSAIAHLRNPGPPIGVLGASSFVGRSLMPLLLGKNCRVTAFSRRGRISDNAALVWEKIDPSNSGDGGEIPVWVSLCPLPVLAALLSTLGARGAKRLVAVSSTSRFTKIDSSDSAERRIASALAKAEESILKWGADTGVDIVILRPTLIYDGVGDKNIASISRFVRRWGWFPVFAPASGLRQPLHVSDVAMACAAALSPSAKPGVYDLSGGETISYREMVARVFAWEGLPQRILEVPSWFVRLVTPILRLVPFFNGLSTSVFERMNENLVFDHSAAAEALGFKPRKFEAPRIVGRVC